MAMTTTMTTMKAAATTKTTTTGNTTTARVSRTMGSTMTVTGGKTEWWSDATIASEI